MPGALIDRTQSHESFSPTHPFEPSVWVPTFRTTTPRTRFITLPAEYISSLLSGRMYAPTTPAHVASQTEIEWSDGTVDLLPVSANTPSTTIEADIEGALAALGGAASPKLATTCPLDATWANFHRSTKCTRADDVLTLLQSSERVLAAVPPGAPAVLALRQWADLHERAELRCFVRDRAVVAMCPRASESTVEYHDTEMDTLVLRISAWFEASVRDVFCGPSRYVLDVYAGRGEQVWVMDFAPWGDTTDALLFEWEELERSPWMGSQGRAQFRCAYRHAAIRPSQRMFHGLPLELRDPQAMTSLAEAAQRLTIEHLEGSDSELSENQLSEEV